MYKNLVLGAGKTGKSAYDFLKKNNQDVCIWDDNPDVKSSFLGDFFSSFEEISRVIISPGLPILWPVMHPLYKEARLRQIPIISDLDLLFLHAQKSKYIGITGTNGKSTTTALLGFCLGKLSKNVHVGGNFGTPALSLPIGDDNTYVLEMSSYQLEASCIIEFDIGVLLNITPDHLDRHGGMSGYVHAKELIFKSQREGVICIDDPYTCQIYEFLKPLMKDRLIPISTQTFLETGYYLDGTMLHHNGDLIWDISEHSTLKGSHNGQNIMATWAVLYLLGYSHEAIRQSILEFKGLAHRQEHVLRTKNGITFINDSKATNADATIQALKAYDDVYLILGGIPKAGGIDDLIPYFHKIRHVLLIGQCAQDFAQVLSVYHVSFTIEKNISNALNFDFKENSTVLLSPACASFDQFENFEQRGKHFKDLVIQRFSNI